MRRGVVRAATRLGEVVRFGLAAGIAGLAASAFAGEAPGASPEPPTYTRDVAPILQQKCQNCHRRNNVGPFSLETYEQARKRASDIASVVVDRTMPPWKPEQGIGPKL